MTWMNEWEVEDEARRYQDHPVLGPATATLANVVNWTNGNSDGWPYWQKPARAAEKLMELIQGERPNSRFDDERADATPAALKVALRPLKSFRTKQGATFEIFETMADIDAAIQLRADTAETAERAELARLQEKYK